MSALRTYSVSQCEWLLPLEKGGNGKNGMKHTQKKRYLWRSTNFDHHLLPVGFGDYSYKCVLKDNKHPIFYAPLPLLKILDPHTVVGVMWRMTKRSCVDVENERA